MKKLNLIALSILLLPTVHAACPDGKTYPVHFTFDDGPHGTLTPRVLDVLKEEKVPATFFVLGERFAGGKSNPGNKTAYAILDRAKKEGHRIGSHTYSHINHPNFSAAKVRENIMKPNPLLKDYLSPVLRLPYGGGSFRSSNAATQAKNDMVMKTVKNAGFKHVGWDIDTNDWDAKKRPTLLATLLKDICRTKGGVVLFHDIQKYTVDNLQSWIKAVKKEGHTFAPMEKFHPEAKLPLPPEACEDVTPSKVKMISKEVEDVLDHMIND
jgi:peptidoglycan/xylan/chitin deacetylase (PgdA/CDA1 family)